MKLLQIHPSDTVAVAVEAIEAGSVLTAGGYTVTNAVTGESISWDSTGYVNKTAIQYVIKEAG